MIQKFVDRFMSKQGEFEALYTKKHPQNYKEIVKDVMCLITDDAYDGVPDPERIHLIDDGDYRGTLVFVVAEKGYQPSDYWYVKVFYGTCSGCDTLKAIQSDGFCTRSPTPDQTKDYYTLALHIVQSLKRMGG